MRGSAFPLLPVAGSGGREGALAVPLTPEVAAATLEMDTARKYVSHSSHFVNFCNTFAVCPMQAAGFATRMPNPLAFHLKK